MVFGQFFLYHFDISSIMYFIWVMFLDQDYFPLKEQNKDGPFT
jgi:hypothetical protein